MSDLRLIELKEISGPSTDIVKQNASYIYINKIYIDIDPETKSGTCTVGYCYGNYINGKFKKVDIIDTNIEGEFVIQAEDFISLAMTAISPSEKALNPYSIVETRIVDYIKNSTTILQD